MSLKSLFRIHCPWFTRLAVCGGLVSILAPAHAQSVAFSQAPFSPIAVGGRPTTPVIVDVNGDGRADIVVALESDHAIAVLLGRPQGGFQPAPRSPFPSGNLPFSIAVADLDGDTHFDVVAVNRTDNHLTLLHGDGLGGFTPLGNPVPTGKEPRAVRIADFNGDGKPDLAVSNWNDSSVSILLGDGPGAFTPAPSSPVAVGGNPLGLTVADFNGDGALDFAAANRADDSVSVFLNDGKAGFTASGSPIAVGSQPFDVSSADLNLDGRVDLVSTDTWSHTVTAFLGEGTGSFHGALGGSVPVQGGYPRMVVAADLNLDGYPDLVTANENSSISLLAGRGNGTLLPMGTSPLLQPNIMNTVAVGDLNGDGAPDLVGCGPDFGLSIWLNAVLKPAIQVSETYANEGGGKARIFLKRESNPDQELSLQVETRDDTAIAGTDYQPIRERVTFAPGQVILVVEVPLIDDDWGSSSRRLLLEFSDASPPMSLPWASAVHIRDNDTPATVWPELAGPGLTADLATIPEGAGPLRFIARRTGSVNSARRFQVRYRIEGVPLPDARPARAGIDFQSPQLEGTFDFGPGVTEQSVEVTLPETTDAEGPRGLSFMLSDSETVLHGGGEAQVVVVIQDNERSALRQVLALGPYLGSLHEVFQLPGGEALLTGEGSLLKLTHDGLPDPTFGAGTGRITIGDSDEVKVLSAGQIQVWDTASVRRWLRNGQPDRAFGDGTGQLVLHTPLLETSETGELLTTRASNGGINVVRFRSDGTRDPRFNQPLPAYSEIAWARTAPDGRIWAGVNTPQEGPGMVILEPDGQRVSNSAYQSGELYLHGFDQAGRGYLEIRHPDGDIQWTRFLANGTPDPGYRLTFPCCNLSVQEVSSDGSVLLITSGDNGPELTEIDPEGVGHVFSSLWNLSQATRLSDGGLLLRTTFCGEFPVGCHLSHFLLTEDGVRVPIRDFSVWWPRPSDPMLFSNTRPTFEGDDTEFRVYRTSIGQRSNEVGIPYSGLTLLESSVRIPLERSGNTAQAATVRGRIFPWIDGRWDGLAAQRFEIRMDVGEADAELYLPSVAQPGSQPVREYLVRLEEATGVALSSFTACRLWVVDEELPEPGRLHLLPYPGPDEANALLAVSRQLAGQSGALAGH